MRPTAADSHTTLMGMRNLVDAGQPAQSPPRASGRFPCARAAFQRQYVDPDGQRNVGTQTSYAMELVQAAETHLATVFLGTPLVLPAPSDNGHHKLACSLRRQVNWNTG